MAAPGPSSPQTTKETPSAHDPKADITEVPPAQSNDHAASPPANATADTTVDASNSTPTYHQTKKSKAYTVAKALLQDGSLEDALSTLELALQCSLQNLTKLNTANADGQDEGVGDDGAGLELHESLAPLYYLYGTTLLYSVEESDVMMANKNGGGGDQDVDDSAEQGGEEEENSNENEEPQESSAAVDTDEDLQIAWENLDIARAIVTRMISEEEIQSYLQSHSGSVAEEGEATIVLKSNVLTEDEVKSSKGTYSPEEFKELVLDLALIHIRLGDLLRANGRNLDAIPDYKRALELRSCLGKFDRAVADSHFGLASTYAESVDLNESTQGSESDGKSRLTQEEIGQFQELSLHHYLECGVALTGLIAELCGKNPNRIITVEEKEVGVAAEAASSDVTKSSNVCSQTLATLRQRVSDFQPLKESDKDRVFDLKESLDEIQEAMDANEDTEKALKDVALMKANEMKKHGAKSCGVGEEGVEKIEGKGVTTTIGFAAPTSNNANGTSASISSMAPVPAAPMMVIKKKKKPQLQPAEQADAKRAKTE
mmetsp:Transcript_31301/g.65447  ORF Transcript_31301/g.65447 Transcript_31301/m.65447 type:complete len:544 (+) Transcript_31301:115-1746(+)